MRDQIFARCDEIIEHILLAREPPGIVPVFAIFATATKIGDRKHPALFQPRNPRCRKTRRQRDIEPAIAIQQRRRRSFGQVFAFDDEHRDRCSVLRRKENLFGVIGLRVERDFRRKERLAAVGFGVEAVNCWRGRET